MQLYHEDVQILNLAQLMQGQDWRLRLLHSQEDHLLIWITRGQGLMLLDGIRRGLGAHNAVFVPAGTLFSMELGRQSVLQALRISAGSALRLPQSAVLLRIREVQAQSELTGLIDAITREELASRPLSGDAMAAHSGLISVWLRRQLMIDDHVPARLDAAQRLSQAFCQMLAERYGSGDVMAAYAADLGVTPTHLTRSTKAATGKTAAHLMAERVLHEARRLLVETKEPAQNIARHLGFGSAAYFTRFMQQHTGLPPTKLRH